MAKISFLATNTFRLTALVVVGALVLFAAAALLSARSEQEPSADGSDAPPPPAPRLLEGYKIVVDAGHGGIDRGVCDFDEELIEKEINLDMAYRLRDALNQQGAEVYMTRTEDRFHTLDDRVRAANESGADLFISLHVNRMPGHPECFGAQTFFHPASEEGKRLALTLQEELLKVDPENYRTTLGGDFKVLRQTKMPGALVEIGFLTNARDRGLIKEEEYRNNITGAIVTGIIRYVNEPPKEGLE